MVDSANNVRFKSVLFTIHWFFWNLESDRGNFKRSLYKVRSASGGFNRDKGDAEDKTVKRGRS